MQEESRAAYLARKHHEDHWGKGPAAAADPKLSRATQLSRKYQEDHYGQTPAAAKAEIAIATAATLLNAIDR